MIGIDTSTLIDLYKKDEKLQKLLQSIDEEIVLNDLTYLELMAGLDPKLHKNEETFYDKLYENIKSLQLQRCSSKKARDIIWNLKKQGKTIHVMDATIASICLNNNVTKIITKNKKDFKHIKKITVLDY